MVERKYHLCKMSALLLGVCFSFCACTGNPSSNLPNTSDLPPISENAGSASDHSSTGNSAPSDTIDVTSVDAQFGNTPNLKCYSIEELANEDVYDPLQQYDSEEYQVALDEGHVLEGVDSSWDSMGATFTLQDVWYEDSTDNMINNDYELSTYPKDPVYIFMKINVRNNSNVEGILFLNAISVNAFSVDCYVQSCEMCYQDHVTAPHPHNSDYSKVSLAIGQSETYTVAFEVGSGFLTYSPIYLNAQAWTEDMLDYDNIYIKLPTLEKR